MRNKRVFLLIILTACFFGVKNVWAADDELGAKIEAALKAHQGGNSASVSSPQDMIDASSDPDLRGKTETVADVNIRNAEISEIGKGQVRLTFDVENSMALQSGLVYGLELYKVLDDNKGNLLADSKVFGDDKLTIEQNGAVSRTVDYQIPDYLTGRFILWLKIKDESGLILAQQSFNASSTGTGQYIELGNPCYLSIDGENPPQQYALDRGVDLRKDEKLFLNCQAHNYASATLETIPSFEVHQRDSYGPMVNSYVEGYENVTLAGGADTLMRIAINLPENPQAYDVKVVLKKKEGKNVISNPVIAHFVITGKSGTIVNASLNKNTYQSGESAQLSLLWAGSADTFSGARMTGNYLVDPSFEVEFKGQDGAVCSQKASYKADDFKTVISMPIQNNCPYPIVSIKLIDEGVVLSSKTINAEPDKGKKGEANGTDRGVLNKIVESKLFILFITIIMLLIILIWIRRNKKRNSGGNMTDASNSIKGLLVILAISSFFWANRASATTDTLYATPFVLQLQDASAYGASFVSMSQCGLDPYSVPLCPWNYWTTSYCRFNVKALWYAPWNGIYGCYQDIVSFTYGLSSTSVSQGSTITASGSSNGVNICNNGVTVGMAMTRYDGDSAWWVIPNTYYNNSNPNASGSYSFSTSGWGCGGYRATVGYAMAHGYSSDVTQNYESYGQGTINYNVNNCCSAPTCATGPGCRTSLANGFSNPGSGTCCSGSCYLCNTNMYWNGSMCTADCSAWSLSLVASPASGSAPLTVNLTANVNAAFGGETYIYSSQSCGSGGPAPINISGNRFTCVYTSAGTYYPSVSARAQSTSCVNSGSATVAVGAAPINASCGLAATTYSSAATAFAGTFCSPGSASPASPAFPAQGSSTTWTCLGSNGGSNATCTASRAQPAVNGVCGTAAVAYLSSATVFSGALCNSGSASPASPAFPAQGSSSTWTCVGSGGGSNATCTASRALPAVNGVCGPAASTYPSSAVAYAGVFCNPGTANPISPVFPAQGASTTWTCAGSGGGSMATCTASRSLPPVNGVCGTAATTYISSATTFSGTLCNPGTASPASPAFPAQGASVSWTCLGSSGGVNASCTATRSIPPPTLSFTADSSSLVYNAATNLRWTTTNATSCWALGDWTGWQTSTGGSANTGNLTASKTYLLECWNAAGVSSGIKSLTIAVGGAPITGFCGPAATTYPSAATTFSGSLCSAGTVSPASPAFPAPGTSTAWNCLGLNGGGNVSCGASRTFPLATLNFTADSLSLAYNSATNIHWATTNATSCWASGDWTGWEAAAGGVENTGNLTASKTYILECWNGNGVSTGQKSLAVIVGPQPAPTLMLTAVPNPFDYNLPATLTWATTNASTCWATGDWTGWKTATGGTESTGNLISSKTYNLECWNSASVSSGVMSVTLNMKTYNCTGAEPNGVNQIECSNTRTGLTSDIPWHAVINCGDKCAYTVCTPDTACSDPCTPGICGTHNGSCVPICGGDCSGVSCQKDCGSCNTGNWQEIAPQ